MYCFTKEMLNGRQLYSVKQLLDLFSSNMPSLRDRERWNVHVLIICICLSVPTNNETVNLVLLQKHVIDEKYSVWISMKIILLK